MKKSRFAFLLVPLLFSLSGNTSKGADLNAESFPWPDPANEIVLLVPALEGAIAVDGSDDERQWAQAGEIKKLYRAEDAAESQAAVSVRVLFDGSCLLFSFSLPAARAVENPRKCFLSDEPSLLRSGGPCLSISLDPQHAHGVYYQFVTDPVGRKQDLRVFDESWDATWQVESGLSAGRWEGEISIPVTEIFHCPADGEVWGFNFALYGIEGRGALSSTPIRINLADAERFGHLLFRGDLAESELAVIKSGLPEIHREQKEARLKANRKICGPESQVIPHELTDLSVGSELKLSNGKNITVLGLDNPPIVRSRFPFYYEKFDNPELHRLRKLFRLDEVIATGKNEFEQILLLNQWLVDHVEFGNPAPIRPQAFHVLNHGLAGQTFNCTFLSFTLTQMYASLGWTARKMTSVGHGTLDLWSDYWRKWIQIDPSRNSYSRIRGSAIPLNSNEIRREFWRNGGVDMEMVFGLEQRAEKVTLETRDKDGLLRYRQGGYAWIAYKTRNNFLEVPYAYRNFLYLIIEDEYNRGKQWLSSNGEVDQRYLFAIRTDRVGDIFWTLNQAFIHLYDRRDGSLKVQLETVTPNFDHFEVTVDKDEWRETAEVFSWKLREGQNFLQVRSVNKFGQQGPEHKVVLLVAENKVQSTRNR